MGQISRRLRVHRAAHQGGDRDDPAFAQHHDVTGVGAVGATRAIRMMLVPKVRTHRPSPSPAPRPARNSQSANPGGGSCGWRAH
jgi:hypothetical protein